MKLTIEIEMNTAAFDIMPEREVSAILSHFCRKIQYSGLAEMALKDYNGNIVGKVKISENSLTNSAESV